MEHRQRRPCSRIRCSRNRCARISASASSQAPERGADPRRPRYAPGRTRRSRSHRQCRQKARAAAHHAPPPWPFSFAPPSRLTACPACRISSPARAGCCRRCHDDHTSAPPPQQIAPPATCTGKDQHRQRRTDDPAAHQLHRLPIAHRQQPAAPDLTAASASRLHLPAAPAHPAALPPACRSGSAPPTTAKRPKTSPPRPAAGGVRFFT